MLRPPAGHRRGAPGETVVVRGERTKAPAKDGVTTDEERVRAEERCGATTGIHVRPSDVRYADLMPAFLEESRGSYENQT